MLTAEVAIWVLVEFIAEGCSECKKVGIYLKEKWVGICMRLTKWKKHTMFMEFPELKIAGS